MTPEQQAAIDALTEPEKAAIQSKQALLKAEEALVEGKTSLEDESLRDAKILLRAQRQSYRERHRPLVIAFEQRYSLWVTKDGIEPVANAPVYVAGA